MKNKLQILSLGTLITFPVIAAAPDNTSRNKNQNITADQQKMNQSDTDITAKIRKELMKDAQLSTYAQNVKIIAVDGFVTLKGPVKSTSERDMIENKAAAVVGRNNVSNEITISN